MAEALRQRGRRDQAMEWYRAALELDAGFAPAHAGLGIALFQSDRHAEVIKAMARALRLQPDLPVASALHLFMGRAYQSLERSEAALQSYERAVEIDPRNTEALDRLAMVHFGRKRYEAALGLYRRLAEIAPSGAQTHANLAATLYHLGRPAEALRSFEQALSLDPDLQMARTGAKHMRKILGQGKRWGVGDRCKTGPVARGLVWCLTNTLTNLRGLLAVGCVALSRVVHATGGRPPVAPTGHRALPTTKMPSQLHKRICETPH